MPISVNLWRTSFNEVTPKFLLSKSSSGVRYVNSPKLLIPSRYMHFRARTDKFKSATGRFISGNEWRAVRVHQAREE